MIADLHAAGVALMVWTVDQPQQWETLHAAGVDAIITNRPAELAGWNAGFSVPPVAAEPTAAVISPTGRLDRAQRPVLAVDTEHADEVTVTVDGAPAEAGAVLDLTRLERGVHTVQVTAIGPGGTVTASSTFTVAASAEGLVHLVLKSGAAAEDASKMLSEVGGRDWRGVAKQATKAKISAAWKVLIIAEALALDR